MVRSDRVDGAVPSRLLECGEVVDGAKGRGDKEAGGVLAPIAAFIEQQVVDAHLGPHRVSPMAGGTDVIDDAGAGDVRHIELTSGQVRDRECPADRGLLDCWWSSVDNCSRAPLASCREGLGQSLDEVAILTVDLDRQAKTGGGGHSSAQVRDRGHDAELGVGEEQLDGVRAEALKGLDLLLAQQGRSVNRRVESDVDGGLAANLVDGAKECISRTLVRPRVGEHQCRRRATEGSCGRRLGKILEQM